MINNDRIVPVTTVDLISLYGLILKVGSVNVTSLSASDVKGGFSVTDNSATLLANEPVATLDFASGVTSSTVYFVPSYNYVGFTKNGAAVTQTGDVEPDGRTLYKAELSSGSVTITKVGF